MTQRHRSTQRRSRSMSSAVSIGLDIGSVGVRAVEVTQSKGRPMISSFGNVPLPEGAMAGGVVKDQQAVIAALKTLWSTHDFGSKAVRLGVSHQQVLVREVEIADLPEKDRRQALPHQVRDAVPLPIEQTILDFRPLTERGAGDTIKGLLVAAPKEPVLDTVRAVEKAGLHVNTVDLSCFAVLRSVATATSGAEAIIDIGASTSLLVIQRDGVPQIVRTIPRGGDEVTRVLSTRLGTTTAEAESLKCTLHEMPDSDFRRDGLDAMNDAIRPLISEFRSSLNFYVNSGPARSVHQISLVGRAAQLPSLVEALRRGVDVPVRIGDPLQYVGAARRKGRRDELVNFRAAAAVSIGLVLGESR